MNNSHIFTNIVSNAYNLPSLQQCQIWLDFDGTITEQDVLDELIKTFAIDNSWKISEGLWQKGLIGSRQCLSEQFDLLRISKDELEQALSQIRLDKGIFAILELCETLKVPAAIVSDCGDIFIEKILDRYGISNLPWRCNSVVHKGDRLKLSFPYCNKLCDSGAAHCKCASIKAMGKPGRKSIYIGDGRSDLCAARKADFIFAKGVLAECLEKEAIGFMRYPNLSYVAACLGNAWQSSVPKLQNNPAIRETANSYVNLPR